jgi:response regulator of citrate/malate metabolism
MKPIDGIELVKELRKHDASCKIMLISATITGDDIKKRLEGFKVDQFIEKPFELCYIHEKMLEMTT